jgi:hypothetical protein
LKSAAAASVEAATATGDENGSTRVARTTMPRNVPTRRPVTIAYEIVRLISRSISNRPCRRIANPHAAGTAIPKPTITTASQSESVRLWLTTNEKPSTSTTDAMVIAPA